MLSISQIYIAVAIYGGKNAFIRASVILLQQVYLYCQLLCGTELVILEEKLERGNSLKGNS